MNKFTTNEVQELLKKLIDSSIIIQGIKHYLNVESSNIEVTEYKANGFHIHSFIVPIDKIVYLRIQYSAGKREYDEHNQIKGKVIIESYKSPNNPGDNHIFQNNIFDKYNPQFKEFFTFLYFEFEKLMIDIKKQGFSNIFNNFTGDGYSLIRKEYDPSKTTWVKFLEMKRKKYNPY